MKPYNSILLCLIFIFLASESISAIPAFARKYNMTCKTCHSPFPHLKDFGDEFAGNGFVLPDQDAPRYFIDTGDEELSLIRDIPVAMRLEAYVTYNTANAEQAEFAAPYLLKFLSGGSLAKDFAYYFYFFFDERGEVAGIEDAFIMFNNLLGSELDVYIGQFQISDPLFKRELRLTLDDYQIYRLKVGQSNVNLTYDRGIMLTYGLETGTDLTFEVLNGSGIGKISPAKLFDNDQYKNFLGRISQSIGDHFRIGAFGFLGKEEVSEVVNETWMAGPDASVSAGPFEINLQYIERRDKNPHFLLTDEIELKTRGALGEVIFRPEGDDSKWYSAWLFNWIESDLAALNLKTAAFHLGYLLKRNIRLIAEYSHNFTDKYGKFAVGCVTAF